jgi:hypothetical protein
MLPIPIIDGVLEIGKTLIKHWFPDPSEAAKQEMELEKMHQDGRLAELMAQTDLAKGQLAINTEEAKSSNFFVAGWRPFVGWMCGAAFGYAAIVEPVSRFVAAVMFDYHGMFPIIDTNLTMQVLFGMLGLGALRTYEKKQGVAKE